MSSVFRLILSQNTALLRRCITQTVAPAAAAAAAVHQHHHHLQTPTTTSLIVGFAVPSSCRFLSRSATLQCAGKSAETPDEVAAAAASSAEAADQHNPLDRTRIVTLSESLGYLASEAYAQTYGERAVWEEYRRNHKGPFAPRRTRRTCVRKGLISTGNPCPICRDEYLLLDHRNLQLLQQFISPHTGEILSYSKTGLCQTKHRELVIAIERARDQGLITFDVPFRQYNYAEYYTAEQLQRAGISAARNN